jgi:hypothetical protein
MKKSAKPALSPALVEELRSAWEGLVAVNLAHYKGDSGTCVCGAGLEVEGRMVLRASSVTSCQGSLIWERGLPAMLAEFEAKHGVKVHYNSGWMD